MPNERRETTEAGEEARGIECRRCGCRHFWVVYTERKPGKIVRRRECRHCGTRITTAERVVG